MYFCSSISVSFGEGLRYTHLCWRLLSRPDLEVFQYYKFLELIIFHCLEEGNLTARFPEQECAKVMQRNWSSSSILLFFKRVSGHLNALPNFLRHYSFNNEPTEAIEKNKVAFVMCPLFSRCSMPSGQGQGSAEYCSGYCSHRGCTTLSYNRSRNVQWSAWKL